MGVNETGERVVDRPIFIVGRQHSGNTMFAHILARHPYVLSMAGEGQFFERREEAERAEPKHRPGVIARLIQESDSTTVSDERRAMIADRLEEDAVSDQPEHLFAQGMRILMEDAGCGCWAQKATSHIFCVEEILTVFPHARFLFLARNPLDIAASFVRRGNRDKLVRMAVGWNRGFRRAERAREAFGERFLIARYEDIVRDPTEVLPNLFSKLGLNYEAGVTEIPVVNRAGTDGGGGGEHGIDSSRVFYYQEQLQKWELNAVRRVVDDELLARHYPQLVERHGTIDGPPGFGDARLWCQGIGSFVVDHLRRGVQQPRSTLRRIRRRLEW